MRVNWEDGSAPHGVTVIDDSRPGDQLDCLWADDETGEYEVLLRRNGAAYTNENEELATEKRVGKLRFMFAELS